ncbi:MAG: hypothetical protein ACRYHA_31680, partial [Janthinobacterium lividum]
MDAMQAAVCRPSFRCRRRIDQAQLLGAGDVKRREPDDRAAGGGCLIPSGTIQPSIDQGRFHMRRDFRKIVELT